MIGSSILTSVFLVRVSADLLSAASLLLATVGLLYSAWYKEITAAEAAPVEDNPEDREPARRIVRSALKNRSRPLLTAAVLLAVILLPPAIGTIVAGLRAIGADTWRYDAAATCFLAVYAITLLLLNSIRKGHRNLRAKLAELDESDAEASAR